MLVANNLNGVTMALARRLHSEGLVSSDVVLYCALQFADLQVEGLPDVVSQYPTIKTDDDLIGLTQVNETFSHGQAVLALMNLGEIGIARMLSVDHDGLRQAWIEGRSQLWGEAGEPVI
jgi:hypothetical protein